MFTSEDYEKFRALRITHVATRLEELLRDEANDALTPEQLFLTAVDDALDARRANRIDKLIRAAGFPIPTATIAELDYREGRGINKTRMRRYALHDWRSEPTNLLITSPTGGGKTYLVCAIGVAACEREHDVTYLRMDDLARRLVIARADGIAHQDLLNKLSSTDLLIIDLCRHRDYAEGDFRGQGGLGLLAGQVVGIVTGFRGRRGSCRWAGTCRALHAVARLGPTPSPLW